MPKLLQVSANADEPARLHVQSTVALYAELDAEYNQQVTVVG